MWGLEEPGEHDRLLVISPHLDDAVMSVGSLLLAHPGAVVATLFAASPPSYTDPLNEHDTACGFQPGTDTMAVRREEDGRALAVLGATPRWLPLCQNSHAERADPIAVPDGAVDAIVKAIHDVEPTCVVAPLGLSHVDHQACHMSALAASECVPSSPWLWYSDLPYTFIPRVLATRFRALHQRGIVASPACPAVAHDFDTKLRAWHEYATQVDVIEGLWQLRDRLERVGEHYWNLDPIET